MVRKLFTYVRLKLLVICLKQIASVKNAPWLKKTLFETILFVNF